MVRTSALWRALCVTVGSSLALGGWAASFPPEGSQYWMAGMATGDQIAPTLSFRATGGCLAWQDNSTDGDGFGISARRLTGQLTGLSSVRVNENGVGDQENPQVASLAGGGSLIVWQSGKRGAQTIVGRVMRSDGRFAGPEFQISGAGTDHREPAVSVGTTGVLVVWAAEGVDGSMLAVQGRRLSPEGIPTEQPFVINQYTDYHQRSPAVAALAQGGFVVAWISEHQRFENSVDVYSRLIPGAGAPEAAETLVNFSERPCATPAVVSLPNGGYLAAWAEHDSSVPGVVWDVYSRAVGPGGGAIGAGSRLNTRQQGLQSNPRLAATGDQVLAVYRSAGGDGYGDGVVGQWLTTDGAHVGDEFVVNSRTAGDQLTATVASDGENRIVVAWSTYNGVARGMDLAGQRYSRTETPLTAPSAPYVFAASSSRLVITWPELAGLGVYKYELLIDGQEPAIAVSGNQYAMSGLVPASQHTVTLRYVLSDGRRSPASLAASGRTWGEDENADGLPDDWQAQFFGANSAGWPSPTADSDHDGVNDRNEFLAGTDPTSAASVLRTRLESNSQGSILFWNTRVGALYQVQWSTNLKTWNDVGSPRVAPGLTDSLPVTDLATPSYFRVNLLR
ncbi:MAG TPA: hypothetical protein PLX89_10715 [Verrucomicrobiota bacterium]|nr:hypothetical protein [Verrucomicrobiota bacterium]